MNRTARLSSLTALAIIGGAASPTDAANLVTNGSFEAGNTGFSSDFAFSSGDIVPAATYDIVADPNNSHGSASSYGDNTSGTGLMLAANGSTSTDTVVWSQEISVTPGTLYEFSLWTSTWFSNASVEILINSNQQGPSFTTPSTTGIWEQTSREWNSGLATTATIEIVNASTGFIGNDFDLDDISFTSVPEPTSAMALIVLGALTARRRRH